MSAPVAPVLPGVGSPGAFCSTQSLCLHTAPIFYANDALLPPKPKSAQVNGALSSIRLFQPPSLGRHLSPFYDPVQVLYLSHMKKLPPLTIAG